MLSSVILKFGIVILFRANSCFSHLEHGSLLGHACIDPGGRNGVCLELQECEVVVAKEPGEFVHPPSLCGFHGNINLYCCIRIKIKQTLAQVPVLQTPLQNLSPVESPILDFECGVLSSDINTLINKEILFPDEFRRLLTSSATPSSIIASEEKIRTIDARRDYAKYMALLALRQTNDRIIPLCGGVLINTQWVLTAAHCLENSTICSASVPCLIRLGEYDLDSVTDGVHEDYDVADIILHDEWLPKIAYHDLALIKLSRKVTFTNHISPVCLPWGAESVQSLVGKNLVFSGWGRMFFTSMLSNPILQEGIVTVIDVNQCMDAYVKMPDFSIKWPQGMSVSNTLCAQDSDGIMDPCTGESGGPAVYINDRNCLTLGGIISLGSGCGNGIPGIYAPIPQSLYLSWIKRTAFT